MWVSRILLCSAEISPDTYDPLFGPPFSVEIADFPRSPVIHLKAMERSNHHIDIMEMRFTAGENFQVIRLDYAFTKIAHDRRPIRKLR